MEGMALCAVLSLAMFVGSYIAGSAPLAIHLSQDKLRLVTVFGAGLLVGTALAVIVPEGVHALYAAGESHDHTPHDTNTLVIQKDDHSVNPSEETHKSHNHEEHSNTEQVDGLIGSSLVCGFIFMLVVDQLARGSQQAPGENRQGRYKLTATIGLVVHAAADGIALGAASSTKHTDLQMIIFLAIMLHKAPAAFGLSVFLMYEGLDKWRIRRHLFIFSSAAPVMAMFTYAVITRGGTETLQSTHATGILMLFSAGTFLYVATVHVLPEIIAQGNDSTVTLTTSSASTSEVYVALPTNNTQSIGHSHSGSGGHFKLNELIALIVGAIAPLFLQMGHSH